MNIASSSSSSPYTPFASPYSPHNTDRDALAQRTLLGEDAYELEESPSPLPTPSPMGQLSPLSVASHLQDDLQHNPFLDDTDRLPITAIPVAPLKHHTSVKSAHRLPIRSSSSSSGLELDIRQEDAHHPLRQTQSARQAPRQAHLPTIKETTRSSSPIKRRPKPSTMITYSLPPSSDSSSTAPSPATWRRPSPFPLGPVPPPLPPRRPRNDPQPHIVDIAVERFKINTHTLSYNPTPAISAQQNERERQWAKWEQERIRANQMTQAAAKNNRVQAPSSSTSSSNRTTSTTSETKPPVRTTKKPKRSWWCLGGGAVESDQEEDEKAQYSKQQRRRSVSSLDDVDVDEEDEEDSDEWNEARTASRAGLLRFSCSKSNAGRRRAATLKKKVQ